MAKEEPEVSTIENSQASSVSQQHFEDMNTKMDRLQVQLSKAASRSEKVEEMFDEQLRVEMTRKAEQERELSQREAKILDLRCSSGS